LQHIDQSVERLIVDEDELRRDPTGIGLAVFFLISTSVLVVFAIRSGDWWLWPIVAFLGLFGVIGLSQDGSRRKRDAKGRPIRDS
jgi:hypothetical protein